LEDYHRATTELAASLEEQDIRRLIDLVAGFRKIIADRAVAIRT
jgi:hypothetical protein